MQQQFEDGLISRAVSIWNERQYSVVQHKEVEAQTSSTNTDR